MTFISQPSHLLNPLASSSQLESSASQLDGVPRDLEDAIRFYAAQILQAAGLLLHCPQELIAQAIILMFRFWIGPDGGSLVEHDAKDVAAAALYLVAKPSAHPISPRQVLTTFAYLTSLPSSAIIGGDKQDSLVSSTWSLSDGELEISRARLYELEATILRVLGFQTHVALPYGLCINYLQTLDAFQPSTGAGKSLAKLSFAHLNTALLSPQLLYLTHQPCALATAAIYLAARQLGVHLPETEWWEVFDVEREELGFLVVALQSTVGFAREQRRLWDGEGEETRVPMTVKALQNAIAKVDSAADRDS